MREFKDSITGKSKDDEDEERPELTQTSDGDGAADAGRHAAARGGRSHGARAPRLAPGGVSSRGAGPTADRARRSAEHRRPPRRAALAPDHLRGRRSRVAFGSASGRTTRCSTCSTARCPIPRARSRSTAWPATQSRSAKRAREPARSAPRRSKLWPRRRDVSAQAQSAVLAGRRRASTGAANALPRRALPRRRSRSRSGSASRSRPR